MVGEMWMNEKRSEEEGFHRALTFTGHSRQGPNPQQRILFPQTNPRSCDAHALSSSPSQRALKSLITHIKRNTKRNRCKLSKHESHHIQDFASSSGGCGVREHFFNFLGHGGGPPRLAVSGCPSLLPAHNGGAQPLLKHLRQT